MNFFIIIFTLFYCLSLSAQEIKCKKVLIANADYLYCPQNQNLYKFSDEDSKQKCRNKIVPSIVNDREHSAIKKLNNSIAQEIILNGK